MFPILETRKLQKQASASTDKSWPSVSLSFWISMISKNVFTRSGKYNTNSIHPKHLQKIPRRTSRATPGNLCLANLAWFICQDDSFLKTHPCVVALLCGQFHVFVSWFSWHRGFHFRFRISESHLASLSKVLLSILLADSVHDREKFHRCVSFVWNISK